MLSKDWYRTSIAVIYVWQQTSCTTGINESIMVSKYKNKQFWYHLNSNFGLVTFVSYLYPQKLVNSEDQKILLVNFQWFILSINKEKYIKESNYLPFWIVISFHSQILFTLKFSRTTVLGKVNICLIGLRLQFEAVQCSWQDSLIGGHLVELGDTAQYHLPGQRTAMHTMVHLDNFSLGKDSFTKL